VKVAGFAAARIQLSRILVKASNCPELTHERRCIEDLDSLALLCAVGGDGKSLIRLKVKGFLTPRLCMRHKLNSDLAEKDLVLLGGCVKLNLAGKFTEVCGSVLVRSDEIWVHGLCG
jgi:hypothetical protein